MPAGPYFDLVFGRVGFSGFARPLRPYFISPPPTGPHPCHSYQAQRLRFILNSGELGRQASQRSHAAVARPASGQASLRIVTPKQQPEPGSSQGPGAAAAVRRGARLARASLPAAARARRRRRKRSARCARAHLSVTWFWSFCTCHICEPCLQAWPMLAACSRESALPGHLRGRTRSCAFPQLCRHRHRAASAQLARPVLGRVSDVQGAEAARD